jgi:16S rRNA (cytidine1402-2'-O)-methyltransferase
VDGGPATGRIVLIATPIGNLGDLSPRAVTALADADVVAAEDTRRTGQLLAHHGLRRPLLRYDDHTERARTDQLVDRAAAGETVVVATDAGTPGISDPGFALVRAAAARDVPVELIPGPVAAIHALVLSGLPTDRFVFDGFLPRRPAQRRARVAELADEPRTMILYLSPHRAADELADLASALGARPAALARELTKVHEEVMRMPLDRLAAHVADHGVRGELTLVIGGAPAPAEIGDRELTDRVSALMHDGRSLRDAVAQVASATGVARSRVYELALRSRRTADGDASRGG